MNWNEKSVKAIVYNRQTAQREQQQLSPREIVATPMGKEIEVIMFALCKVVDELCIYKEAELERIGELHKKLEAQKMNQIEMPLEN